MRNIPFNKPYISGNEINYMSNALARGKTSGDGFYTKKTHSFIEDTFGTNNALLTTSCSTALDMACLLLDLKEGDEVILPSFTFVSTANAVMLRGAIPVFADIQKGTLNIDPNDIDRKVTTRTKAIMPVHYAGVSCEMGKIMDLAEAHDLKVIEDAAQGVNAKYKGKYLGTIGDIGCYSFHDTKNYSCGEGGAILINKSDEFAKRAEIIREKGTNRSQFIRGEIDKYTWVDLGSSLLPSDVLAAYLWAQFEQLEEIKLMREKVYDRYLQAFKPLEQREYISLPVIPGDCESNYHIFHIVLESEEVRNTLLQRLKEIGIMATFHYIPLHLSPMGKRLGCSQGQYPNTESLSTRLLRLPLYPELTDSDIDYIIANVYEILNNMMGISR